VESPAASGSAAVAVLADDLIWGTRLAATIDALDGAHATRIRTLSGLETWLADAAPTRGDAVIVDLTARAYDGLEAIALARARGVRTLAVGQHDDLELRRRARAAGAEHVYAYRKLFEDGPATLARWLGIAPEAVIPT
jgi:DNA-binding NarL/FixJ family response regulator